jgi:GalNAc-alpha-(1->4)-GalNAc-alpha-(1->3)-diNAcBac-PP-undecaprenol alpha-1,4-N-acetyl-D-galactosaminyltransferase
MTETPKQNRIVFVIAHLGPGGAQRVAATAANALVERGVEVHVVTVLDDPPDAYDLDPKVRRHRQAANDIGAKSRSANAEVFRSNGIVGRAVSSLARAATRFEIVRRPLGIAAFGIQLTRRTRWLRRTIREIQAEAVLSFLTQTNILTILATRGLRVRTVVSERNDPRLQRHRRRVAFMRKLLYRWPDLVTANTRGGVAALEAIVPKRKLAFLPNPLSSSDCEAAHFSVPTFITVTRLVEQKGIDVLLKATAQAFERLPDWRLAILGDGPLRDYLQALAGELGIASRVDWLGYVEDPTPYLKAAKFFVLTSRFEGSPNALLEAMACGLPAIVSNASPGPLELVGENEAGLVVPVEDAGATAEAILKLAQDEELRATLGAAANERTRVHRLDDAMLVWRELLGA